MSPLPEREGSEHDFLQIVFDATPIAMFVLGEDLSIRDFNDAAGHLPEDVLISTIRPDLRGERIGDFIRCVHSVTDGCGKARACNACGVVNATEAAMNGSIYRNVVPIRINRNGHPTTCEYLVSTALQLRGGCVRAAHTRRKEPVAWARSSWADVRCQGFPQVKVRGGGLARRTRSRNTVSALFKNKRRTASRDEHQVAANPDRTR